MISGRVAVVAAGGREGSRPSAIVGGSKTVSVSAVASARRGVATSPAVLGRARARKPLQIARAPWRTSTAASGLSARRAPSAGSPGLVLGAPSAAAEGVVLFIPPGDRRLLVVALRVGVLGNDLGGVDGERARCPVGRCSRTERG